MNERATVSEHADGVTLIEALPDWGTARPQRSFEIEVFDGDLDAAHWPSIGAGPELAMHVYQAREFLEVWIATIGKARGCQCFLVVVKDGRGKPVIYLPLTIEITLNVRILRFMDAGVADFNGPILAADHAFSKSEFLSVWTDILSALPPVDVVDLQKIARDMDGVHNPMSWLDCTPYHSSGHAIELSPLNDGSNVSRSVTRMHRKLCRMLERLSETGTTEFLVNPSDVRLEGVVDTLFDLKRQQYLRTTGSDFFAMPGVYEFYREMTQPARFGHVSHLSALTCAGKVVSAHLGFYGRGRLYWVLPAFDTDYRFYGVGNVLLDFLLSHCSENGYAAFDLGEGDFPYKNKWANKVLPLFSHQRGVTAKGAIYYQLRRAWRSLRLRSHYESFVRDRLSAIIGAARRKKVHNFRTAD